MKKDHKTQYNKSSNSIEWLMDRKHPREAPIAAQVSDLGDEGQMLLDLEERAAKAGIDLSTGRFFDLEHLKQTGEIVYTADAEEEYNKEYK